MDFLLATDSNQLIVSLVIIGLLVVFLIYMFVSSNKKRAQYMDEMKKMQERLVPGTKVKTYAGEYGEIVSVRDALDGSKVATVKIGVGQNTVDIEMDLNYISNIDEKDNAELYGEDISAEQTSAWDIAKEMGEQDKNENENKEQDNNLEETTDVKDNNEDTKEEDSEKVEEKKAKSSKKTSTKSKK